MAAQNVVLLVRDPLASPRPDSGPLFEQRIESLKRQFADLWWSSSTGFPELARVTFVERRANERKIEASIDDLEERLLSMPVGGLEREQWGREMRQSMQTAARREFGGSPSSLDSLLSDQSFAVTESFLNEARAFDPRLEIEDLFQALRNVWIMNSLQLFRDRPIAYSPSVFAYSMLYPCTDNPLDDPSISREQKRQVGMRLRDRLSGLELVPSSVDEAGLFKLVERIEGEYSRDLYPEVFESLLAIHRAQQNSLRQQNDRLSPYEADLLSVSLEKGGTSVLADGYLVAGRLEADEEAFCFGYGAVLQLLDDAQDVAGDARAGHQTLFSQTAGRWPLDALMNRLFHFLDRTLDTATCFSTEGQASAEALIRRNCRFSILQAVAENPRLVSNAYSRALEEGSPLSFSYLRRLRKSLGKRRRKLEKKMPRGGLMAPWGS